MRVGIPREVKDNEYRVAITPSGVHELTGAGHTVYVEKEAGVGSSLHRIRRAKTSVRRSLFQALRACQADRDNSRSSRAPLRSIPQA